MRLARILPAIFGLIVAAVAFHTVTLLVETAGGFHAFLSAFYQ